MMTGDAKYFKLSNGVEMPSICFGTNITLPPLLRGRGYIFIKALYLHLRELVRHKNPSDWGRRATFKASRTLIPLCREAVLRGITAFDCSRAYGGSEKRLAIALNKYPRDSVFIITKIDDSSQFMGRVEECFEQSLQQLRTDYADLLLLHWPVDYPPFPDEKHCGKNIPVYARSWKTLEKIYMSGRARAIGVSNFTIKHLDELKNYAEIMPMANEFECHPLCIRTQLNDYCLRHDIQVLAYAALCGMDQRLRIGGITKIAEKHGKSIAQLVLRWHVQSGRVPIFGTTKKERLISYADIFDFELSKEELETINAYNANYRGFPDSERCDFTKGIWLGWEKYKDCCP
jgi:diketogulonate reductase-like aldo/keto reductase